MRTWHWNKYVLMFFKLYFIHISKYILLLWAQNTIKQYKWYFSRKLLCQGVRKCKFCKTWFLKENNSNLGVGGRVKLFLQKWMSCSWTQKSPFWTRKLFPNYLHSNEVDIWYGFWDISKYITISCPSWKSGKQAKKRNFLISNFNYQRYTNRMKLAKKILHNTKVVKIQNGR